MLDVKIHTKMNSTFITVWTSQVLYRYWLFWTSFSKSYSDLYMVKINIYKSLECFTNYIPLVQFHDIQSTSKDISFLKPKELTM